MASIENQNYYNVSTQEWMRYEKEFDKILRECIDGTLKKVLGEATSTIILYHIGNDSLSEGIEFFAEALERILGTGAYILEWAILKELYSCIELKIEEKPNYKFADYVKEARTTWFTEKTQKENNTGNRENKKLTFSSRKST
ncbi:hypothetical protein KEJ18_04995 [Candidatus Bathyarchaeota archaeon]|nr:hypothetical protein [Candidatus Bathyarchaeota archaeon]